MTRTKDISFKTKRAPGSCYVFDEGADFFRVRSYGRKNVLVMLKPTYLLVKIAGNDDRFDTTLGFYEYRELCKAIFEGLFQGWVSPQGHVLGDPEKSPYWLRPWLQKRIGTALGKRIHRQWKRLLTQVDPLVLAVHRKVFAATMGCCDLVMDEELYHHNKYIIKDILRYRAAAIAVANADDLVEDMARRVVAHSPETARLQEQLRQLVARAKDCGLSCGHYGHEFEFHPDRRPATLDSLTAMENWRGLFSYSGRPYRSLNRTLMNLPGGVPHKLVANLTDWRLERPYVKRLELTTLLLFGELALQHRHNTHVFEHARAPQIKEAMRRVANHTRNDLSARHTKDIGLMVGFLADYPGEHTGNIVGLADASIRWHRVDMARVVASTAKRLGPDTKTALPPIPLPKIDGVSFLSTVEEVCREGQQMSHCIASYAKIAIEGSCYLFHAEHNSDKATIELGPDGQVIQVHGPNNRRNGAGAWARRVLNRWGQDFPVLE